MSAAIPPKNHGARSFPNPITIPAASEDKILITIFPIGIADSDTDEIADKMIRKMLKLRIFDDENGKTNLSIDEVGGELLLISQFTLYADCKKGNRPSFFKAGNPEMASNMYDSIIEKCRSLGYKTECGKFGAEMAVSLLNDGPFTIVLDSDDL